MEAPRRFSSLPDDQNTLVLKLAASSFHSKENNHRRSFVAQSQCVWHLGEFTISCRSESKTISLRGFSYWLEKLRKDIGFDSDLHEICISPRCGQKLGTSCNAATRFRVILTFASFSYRTMDWLVSKQCISNSQADDGPSFGSSVSVSENTQLSSGEENTATI